MSTNTSTDIDGRVEVPWHGYFNVLATAAAPITWMTGLNRVLCMETTVMLPFAHFATGQLCVVFVAVTMDLWAFVIFLSSVVHLNHISVGFHMANCFGNQTSSNTLARGFICVPALNYYRKLCF